MRLDYMKVKLNYMNSNIIVLTHCPTRDSYNTHVHTRMSCPQTSGSTPASFRKPNSSESSESLSSSTLSSLSMPIQKFRLQIFSNINFVKENPLLRYQNYYSVTQAFFLNPR